MIRFAIRNYDFTNSELSAQVIEYFYGFYSIHLINSHLSFLICFSHQFLSFSLFSAMQFSHPLLAYTMSSNYPSSTARIPFAVFSPTLCTCCNSSSDAFRMPRTLPNSLSRALPLFSFMLGSEHINCNFRSIIRFF